MTSAVRIPDGVRLGGMLLVAVAVQAIVTSRVLVLGVSADLFLVLAVLVALGRGSTKGALFGFGAGLLADIIYLEPLGLRTFIYLMLGYGVGRYSEILGVASAWTVVLLAAVSAFAAELVYGLFQVLAGQPGSFWAMLQQQVLPAALLDALVAAPLYLGLVRLGILDPPGGAGPSFK